MFPHMRHIHKLEAEGESAVQSTQCDDDVEENGIGIVERDVLAEVGCDESSVCE